MIFACRICRCRVLYLSLPISSSCGPGDLDVEYNDDRLKNESLAECRITVSVVESVFSTFVSPCLCVSGLTLMLANKELQNEDIGSKEAGHDHRLAVVCGG